MSILHRWHASVVGNNDARTAVCAHSEVAAKGWLTRRMHDAVEETADADLRGALEDGIKALPGWDSSSFHWEVDGEVFVIERHLTLGDFGHESCLNVDQWVARTRGHGSRWKRWYPVGYHAVD